MDYPPFARLAVVTVKALKESTAAAVAQRLAEGFKRSAHGPDLKLLGPAATLRPQLYGKYRRQILVKAPDSRRLHEALHAGLKAARSEPGRSHVWFEVDVDPQRIG
ncbi:MAG: hypothetical protein HY204_05785 [Nitrospirae bacterium]|nr:hypothetical protein [Nitrospirota bacterium]